MYEVIEGERPGDLGIRYTKDNVSWTLSSVSDNRKRMESVVWVFNQNELLPEHLIGVTESLIGVLL